RRKLLARSVNGIGLKEASHFLRNIGVRGLAIIDRHLLTNLVRCGVYVKVPQINTVRAYQSVEEAYSVYCFELGIDMDEVDLLFWCNQTGHILK
ncbi:MAG: DNA lyase, partial [Candidatus Kapabacteria bacterium]|nr:DNA lyase [Candidatus Kapabacteria bacterium]